MERQLHLHVTAATHGATAAPRPSAAETQGQGGPAHPPTPSHPHTRPPARTRRPTRTCSAPQIVHVKRFNKKYVLYQCGTPDPTGLPAGAADGVKPGMQSFEVPLYSAAATDTTVNGFLVRLQGRPPHAGLPCGAAGIGVQGRAQLMSPRSPVARRVL